MKRRKVLQLFSAILPASLASKSLASVKEVGVPESAEGKYSAVMAAFPEGCWVFGLGEHIGCSQTFDYEHPDRPQPFSYLDSTDPADFRMADAREILEVVTMGVGNGISVEEAMERVKRCIHDDDELAWGWHCNIAMASFDEGMDYDSAQKAARRFMGILFERSDYPNPYGDVK